MRTFSFRSSCAPALWFYVVCNKTGLRDGVWGGRISISSLLWHLTIISVPNMLFCWFIFQTQLKISNIQLPFIRKAQSRERSFMYEQVMQRSGWSSGLEAGDGTPESGALTASGKGFRSKSVQEHHKDADASARKWKSPGASIGLNNVGSRQHDTRNSPVDLTFLNRCLKRFKRN